MTTNNLENLTDEALLSETQRVAGVERSAMAELLALLIEVERRHLCEKLGYPSLFVYCTQALGLSEQAAYSRITAARAIRRVPAMLPMLAEGALTLSSVERLAPHLTDDNQEALLAAAQNKSTRVVERIVAAVLVQPDIEASMRAVAARSAAQPAVVAPLAPQRYLLKVTIGQEAHDQLERARALLRHVIPNGDPAALVERALGLLVKDAERTKCAETISPRRSAVPVKESRTPSLTTPGRSRAIPAAVRRSVWRRDRGQCAFVGSRGRCGETGFLEYHHVRPFAAGGETTVGNLELRCRAHNAFEARVFFGGEVSSGP